jgi:hypothetical protein
VVRLSPLRGSSESERARTERSFCVPKGDIVALGYDLSLNRYKEIVHDGVEHRPPLEIIAEIEKLEGEMATGWAELKADAVVKMVPLGQVSTDQGQYGTGLMTCSQRARSTTSSTS